jgi:hypothetical protein
MIKESVSVKMRGDLQGLRTVSNTVTIKITGRADLDTMAQVFDREAAALRKEGKHPRAAKAEACARLCRKNKTFQITMPAELWAKRKGGA